MKPAARAAIHERMRKPIDLSAITQEQATFAILDRALLWAELETSWWRSARFSLALILLPAALGSLALYALRSVWGFSHLLIAAPFIGGVVLLGAVWFADLLMLAREGAEARQLAILQHAVKPAASAPEDIAAARRASNHGTNRSLVGVDGSAPEGRPFLNQGDQP